jgi:hypothetical protein
MIMTMCVTQAGLVVPPQSSWVTEIPGDSSLLMAARVQTELRLASDKVEKIRTIIVASNELQRKELDRVSKSNLSPSASREAISAVYRTRAEECDRAISEEMDGRQFLRYKQISTQLRGVAAFGRPEIILVLELDEPRIKQTKGIVVESRNKIRDAERNLNPQDPNSLKEFRGRTEQIQKMGVALCLGVLNEKQKRIWDEMTGAPFSLNGR